MGFGDQLMAAGQAQTLFDASPADGPVMLVDQYGSRRWQPLWDRNPAILQPDMPYVSGAILQTGKNRLPYLQYPYSAETGWRFSPTWRARDHRGRIYLTEEEFNLGIGLLKQMGPYVIIEPSGRDRKNRNRCWPFPRWQALASLINETLPWPLLQLDHDAADRLAGVGLVENHDFREACGMLSGARLFIGPEGGLAHAAAALGVPAVVIWGGCISADVLGYPEHVNLIFDHPKTPCGSLKSCAHCAEGWHLLTPAIVLDSVQVALGHSAVPLAAGVQ